MYSPELLDHFANPRNAGDLEAATHRIACENPVCGDQLRLALSCVDDRVTEIRFLARGCTASIACASALTELVKGRTRVEVADIRAADIEAAVGGLNPESKHAAVLCSDALRKLEAQWKTS